MSEKFKQIITERLVALGWTAADGTAVARKTFETAVGLKEALAYVAIGDQACLSGEYQSEGRNALAQCLRLIPRSTELAVVEDIAGQFAADVDIAVAGTYAARLHRPRP